MEGWSMNDRIHFMDRGIEVVLYKQKQSKNWYGQIQYNKKQVRFSTRSNDVEKSKQHCYKIVNKLLNSNFDSNETIKKVNRQIMTFRELFNSFLEYKKNTGSCQTSTLNNYGRWGKPILSFCGDMCFASVGIGESALLS